MEKDFHSVLCECKNVFSPENISDASDKKTKNSDNETEFSFKDVENYERFREIINILGEVLSEYENSGQQLFDETVAYDESKCIEFEKLEKIDNSKIFYNYKVLNTSISTEDVIKRIKNAQKWEKIDSYSSGIRILLYGVSGGGKSAFAEHVAEDLGKKVKKILASDILASCVGDTEKNIREIFSEAKEENAVIIIDEADSVLMSRDFCKNTWEISQVNEFLIQMESFPGILFCSTNFREKLDSALDRRFHFKIEFFPLEEQSVEMLLKGYFPQFSFSQEEVDLLLSFGKIVPGDFGNVFSRIRFSDPDEVNKKMLINEFKDLVESKQEYLCSHRKIGFVC